VGRDQCAGRVKHPADGCFSLLLDYDVVHFHHHVDLDTGDIRLHIVVEPVLEVVPALPYLRYVNTPSPTKATWATNPGADRTRGVSCSDTLSYMSVVIPEADNLANTDIFAPLRFVSCAANSTLLTSPPSRAGSVGINAVRARHNRHIVRDGGGRVLFVASIGEVRATAGWCSGRAEAPPGLGDR